MESQAVPFAPEFPKGIDATIINAWRSCPTKCWYSYFRGLSPLRPSPHLHFGAAFASGAEATRLAYYADGRGADEAIAEGSRAILTTWGDTNPQAHDLKSLENCLALHEAYFDTGFPLESPSELIPYRVSEGAKPQVEFSFAIPLPFDHPDTNEPLLYTGRTDFIGVRPEECGGKPWTSQSVWIVDDKTTSRLGASWSQQWRLRGQFLGYTWAGRQYGLSVKGALVRGACVYKARPPDFQQCFLEVNDGMLDKWYDNLLHTVAHMLQCWGENRYDMSFGEACASYGGCEFLSLCEMTDPEPFIPVEYAESRWSPLERVKPLELI